MHYGEMTPETLEQAALSGTLTVFELEDIILIEHPSLTITENTWKAAYKKEISSRIKQAIGDIDYASKHFVYPGYYKETIMYLKDAEKSIKEAQKKRFEINLLEFEEGVKKVLDGTKDSFEGSSALMSFMETSEFGLKKYKTELQNRLSELGRQYTNEKLKEANEKLKESRITAKYLKRSFKTGKDYLSKLENNIKVLEELKDYGITDGDICQIKDVAYKSGVERLLNIAKYSAISNRKKSERIIKTAARNAERLGSDVSSEADEIRQILSGE